MKCTSIFLLALAMASPAYAEPASNGGLSSTAEWRKLSQVNEPANQPSKRAAKVATQGMTRAQIKAKHIRLVQLYREASAVANGTALQILRREIQLLQLAGAE